MRVAIISSHDLASAGKAKDTGGETVQRLVEAGGASVVSYAVLPCERRVIASEICRCADHQRADLILTVGGTGLGASDVSVDATSDAIELEVPGIADVLRAAMGQRSPDAMLSRATAGVRQESLVINLVDDQPSLAIQLQVLWPALPLAMETLKGREFLERSGEDER